MSDRKPNAQGRDGEEAVSDAVEHVEEGQSALDEARARDGRPGSSWAFALIVGVLLLAAVAAWNVWSFSRPPRTPPDAEVAFALRETAGALAEEILAIRDAEGRLPTAAELADQLDEQLSYEPSGDSFVVTNTDGVLRVTYDGSRPVAEWVVNGGYNRVERKAR